MVAIKQNGDELTEEEKDWVEQATPLMMLSVLTGLSAGYDKKGLLDRLDQKEQEAKNAGEFPPVIRETSRRMRKIIEELT